MKKLNTPPHQGLDRLEAVTATRFRSIEVPRSVVGVEGHAEPPSVSIHPITKLGPDAVNVLAALRVFYEIAREFSSGRTSLGDVAKALETRQMEGKYPESLPTSKASVHRYMSDVERFFGRHLGTGTSAVLLVRNGEGRRFSGLTRLGNAAWKATAQYLSEIGMVEEEC